MNYKEIAKQGRYGDTELRIVDGQPSHVNTSEARYRSSGQIWRDENSITRI